MKKSTITLTNMKVFLWRRTTRRFTTVGNTQSMKTSAKMTTITNLTLMERVINSQKAMRCLSKITTRVEIKMSMMRIENTIRTITMKRKTISLTSMLMSFASRVIGLAFSFLRKLVLIAHPFHHSSMTSCISTRSLSGLDIESTILPR